MPLPKGTRMYDGEEINQAIGASAPRVVVPVTGTTLTLTPADTALWINPAAGIQDLTVRLPSSAIPGGIVNLGFGQNVAAMVVQQPNGTQIGSGSVVAGQGQQYRYINVAIGWARWI